MTESNQTQQQTPNPLLAKLVLPGERVVLPSLGLFYTNGEVADSVVQSNGEIYVSPMVTFDEIVLKTPDKLFSGDAIYEVFSRCIPSILKPEELLAIDVDYLLVCLRKISYGDFIPVEFDHKCEKSTGKQRYDVNISEFIQTSVKVDPTTLSNTYSCVLGNGQVVSLNPPRFAAALKLFQLLISKDGLADIDTLKQSVIGNLAGMINSVDGTSDNKLIVEWLSKLPIKEVNTIKDQITKYSKFGINFSARKTCRDCNEEIDLETQLNPVNFFS